MRRRGFCSGVGALALSVLTAHAAPMVQSGESIAFLGDSITEQGAKGPGGYVNLVISGLMANGLEVKPIPAGIGGNTSAQMLARLPAVLEKKPVWMTVSCGVNDVNRQMTLEEYEKNVRAIVDKAQAAGVKVILFTASMIGENPDSPKGQIQAAFNDSLRRLARERSLPLVEINGAMWEAVKATPHTGDLLTVDSVHMNPSGNAVMAAAVLRGLGLDDAQIAKARESWLDTAETGNVAIKIPLTLRQFETLQHTAQERKQSALAMIESESRKAVDAQLKAAAPSPR